MTTFTLWLILWLIGNFVWIALGLRVRRSSATTNTRLLILWLIGIYLGVGMCSVQAALVQEPPFTVPYYFVLFPVGVSTSIVAFLWWVSKNKKARR